MLQKLLSPVTNTLGFVGNTIDNLTDGIPVLDTLGNVAGGVLNAPRYGNTSVLRNPELLPYLNTLEDEGGSEVRETAGGTPPFVPNDDPRIFGSRSLGLLGQQIRPAIDFLAKAGNIADSLDPYGRGDRGVFTLAQLASPLMEDVGGMIHGVGDIFSRRPTQATAAPAQARPTDLSRYDKLTEKERKLLEESKGILEDNARILGGDLGSPQNIANINARLENERQIQGVGRSLSEAEAELGSTDDPDIGITPTSPLDSTDDPDIGITPLQAIETPYEDFIGTAVQAPAEDMGLANAERGTSPSSGRSDGINPADDPYLPQRFNRQALAEAEELIQLANGTPEQLDQAVQQAREAVGDDPQMQDAAEQILREEASKGSGVSGVVTANTMPTGSGVSGIVTANTMPTGSGVSGPISASTLDSVRVGPRDIDSPLQPEPVMSMEELDEYIDTAGEPVVQPARALPSPMSPPVALPMPDINPFDTAEQEPAPVDPQLLEDIVNDARNAEELEALMEDVDARMANPMQMYPSDQLPPQQVDPIAMGGYQSPIEQAAINMPDPSAMAISNPFQPIVGEGVSGPVSAYTGGDQDVSTLLGNVQSLTAAVDDAIARGDIDTAIEYQRSLERLQSELNALLEMEGMRNLPAVPNIDSAMSF